MADRRAFAIAVCAGLLVLTTMSPRAQDRGLARVRVPIGPQGQLEDLYTASHALLVGVARYQDRAAWNTLESVESEIRSLEEALKAHGFNTHVVLNPTGGELRNAVNDFIDRYGYDKGTRLFLFFAGHGHTIGQAGYFVPTDAPDPDHNESGFLRTALSMRQIALWASLISAKHALFAFDSCFSGTIFRTRDRQPSRPLSAATAQPVREFLSAGEAGQPVPAESIFTKVLVKALNGADGVDVDGDGFITGTELGNFVQREVIEYGTRQTPQFGKIREPDLDLGDIVFLPPRTGAPILQLTAGAPSATSAAEPRTRTVDAGPAAIATSERAAIEEALDEYRRAYEARSVDRLKRVFPTLPDSPTVEKMLNAARQITVALTATDIRLESATDATATSRLTQNLVPKVGIPRNVSRNITVKLRKDAGRWVIVSLK